MYQCVTEFMEKLDEIKDEFMEEYGCAEYSAPRGEVSEGRVEADRIQCLKLLTDIFEEKGWSEEFVTAFGVYCNFYILTGMYQVFGEEDSFGLEVLYEKMEEQEDKEYLEYIRRGIYEQEYEAFLEATEIYGYSLPWLYRYIITYKALILYDKEDLNEEENREIFMELFRHLQMYLKEIDAQLKEYTYPEEVPLEEVENINKTDYLPCIKVIEYTRESVRCMKSDLQEMAEISGQKSCENFQDIWKGWIRLFSAVEKVEIENPVAKIYDTPEWEKYAHYYFFLNSFFERLKHMKVSREYDYMNYERDSSLFERKFFLMLPLQISPKGAEMFSYARELQLWVEREKLMEKNRRMVEDYSHSVENIIKPFLINEVAELLRQDEKYHDLYRKLIQAYNSEVTTRNECRLLKMAHDFTLGKGAIRESISRCKEKGEGKEQATVTLEELFCQAAEQVIREVLEDDRSRMEFVRKKLAKEGYDIQELEEACWQREQNRKAGGWTDRRPSFLNMEFRVAEELKNLRLQKEEMGTTFLYTRLVELLVNAFTYGAFGNEDVFSMSLTLKVKEMGKQYIVLEEINTIGDREYCSGKNGLESMNEMLRRINSYNPERENFVETQEAEGIFHTKVYFDAELYM